MWCRGRMGPKELCCIVPFHFDGFYSILCYFSPKILMHYIRTLHDKYFLTYDGFFVFFTGRFSATQDISMHFFQSKSTKCKFFEIELDIEIDIEFDLDIEIGNEFDIKLDHECNIEIEFEIDIEVNSEIEY